MKDDVIENNDIITRAIESLKMSVVTSKLPDNEKKALYTLLEKLTIYYQKKLSIIAKKNSESTRQKEISVLSCFITDILVEINSVLIGDNDIYYFVSIVNKKLHDKDLDNLVTNNKRK